MDKTIDELLTMRAQLEAEKHYFSIYYYLDAFDSQTLLEYDIAHGI